MLFRSLLICLILAFFASASVLHFRYIPDDFVILFREETTVLFRDLSDSDKVALKDLQTQNRTYKSDDDALQALKDKSASLYAQFNHYYKQCKAEVEPLNDEAQQFVKEVVEKIRSLRPADGQRYKKRYLVLASAEVLYKYNNLSDAAQEEIKTYLGLGSAFKSAISGAGEMFKSFTGRFAKFFNKS